MQGRLDKERSKVKTGRAYLESGTRNLDAARVELERVRNHEIGAIADIKSDLRRQGLDASKIKSEKNKILREWSTIVKENDKILSKKDEIARKSRNVDVARTKLAVQVDKLEDFRDDLSLKRKTLLSGKDAALRSKIDNEIEREWLARRKEQMDLERKLGDAANEVRNIRLEIDQGRDRTRTPGRTRGFSGGDDSLRSSPLTAATTTTGGSLLEYRTRW